MQQLTRGDSLAVEPETQIDRPHPAEMGHPLPQNHTSEDGLPLVPAAWDRPTLTIAEAGRFLGLSRTAAYRAATSGHIPTHLWSLERWKTEPGSGVRGIAGYGSLLHLACTHSGGELVGTERHPDFTGILSPQVTRLF